MTTQSLDNKPNLMPLSAKELLDAAIRKAEVLYSRVTIYEEERWKPVIDLIREAREKSE